MFKKTAVFSIIIALLTSCNTTGSSNSFADRRAANEAKGIYDFVDYHDETGEIEFSYGDATRHKMSWQEFEQFVSRQLVNQTVIFHNFFQGTQIEYFSSEGEVALWYPGNKNAVTGKFYFEDGQEKFYNLETSKEVFLKVLNICFSYQENSRNPLTGAEGSEPQCRNAYEFLIDIKGKREGDVFNLSSGKLPLTFQKNSPPKWPDGGDLVAEMAPHSFQ